MQNEAFYNLRVAVEQLTPLTEDQWDFLKSFFEYRIVDPKTILIAHGSVAQELFFIHSGLLRIYYTTANNDQITAFIFSENLFAGCLESFYREFPACKHWKHLKLPAC